MLFRSFSFSTLAVPWIRGTILDELKKQDPVPRSIRNKKRKVVMAEEKLMKTLERQPTESELAEELKIDINTLWEWKRDIDGVNEISIDKVNNEESQPPLSDMLIKEGELSPEEIFLKEENRILIKAALKKLKEEERFVLKKLFYEGKEQKEVGQMLGLTQSRISQIRADAIGEIRSMLRKKL